MLSNIVFESTGTFRSELNILSSISVIFVSITKSVYSMKIIITGATGMVGEGILLECLQLPQVTEI
jgi:hypothetical protein